MILKQTQDLSRGFSKVDFTYFQGQRDNTSQSKKILPAFVLWIGASRKGKVFVKTGTVML